MAKFRLSASLPKTATTLLIGGILAAAAMPGFAASVELTLDDAIGMALKSNPAIKISAYDVEKANWDIKVAKAGKSPSITLNHDASRYKTTGSTAYVYNYSSLTDKPKALFKPDYLTTSYANSINLTYPLYSGGKLEGTIEKAELSEKSSNYGLDKTKQQIKLDATSGYYKILQARNTVKLREESLDQLTTHLKNVRAQFDAGTVAKSDVLRSETEKASAEQNLIIAKNSYEISVADLNNIIGLQQDTELSINDELKYENYDKALADCITYAFAHRPDLAQAATSIDIANASIKVAKSGNKLSLNAVASEKWTDKDFPGMDNNTWSIGISASYNLFDAGSTRSEIKGAEADLAKAKEQLRQTKDNAEFAVREAYLNMKEAEKRINTSKVAVVSGEEDFKIAQVRYSAGVGTNIDVIDAQVSLTSAKNDYVQALYDYNVNRAKLENAMGMPIK